MATQNLTLMQNLSQRARYLSAKIAPAWVAKQAVTVFANPRRRPITESDQAFLDTAEKTRIASPHGQLMTYRWGEATAPAILLVHGWERNASVFRALIPHLVSAGYQAIALDGVGHGASEGSRANLVQYSNGIYATVQHYGAFQGVIAHSYGGAAMGLTLARYPHLAVKRAILIGAPESLLEVFPPFVNGLGLPASLIPHMLREVEREVNEPIENFTLSRRLPATHTPLLLVHDLEDPVVPFEASARVAAAVPHARLHRTRKLGHRMALQNQDVREVMLAFLGEN